MSNDKILFNVGTFRSCFVNKLKINYEEVPRVKIITELINGLLRSTKVM